MGWSAPRSFCHPLNESPSEKEGKCLSMSDIEFYYSYPQ